MGAQGAFDPSCGGNHNLGRAGRSDDLAMNIEWTFGSNVTLNDQITGKDAAANADKLFVFHREVEAARKKLADGYAPVR